MSSKRRPNSSVVSFAGISSGQRGEAEDRSRLRKTDRRTGGVPISRGHLCWILSNPIYVGRLRHKGQIHDGLHASIIDPEV